MVGNVSFTKTEESELQLYAHHSMAPTVDGGQPGYNTALIPSFSAADQDSSAVPPISPEVETCPIGEKGHNDPQTPRQHDSEDSSDIADNHRPHTRDNSGTRVSAHNKMSATKDTNQDNLGIRCVQKPQHPLSTRDPSRPEYPVDGGSAESTHGDLSSCTDKSLIAQQEVRFGTAIDLCDGS